MCYKMLVLLTIRLKKYRFSTNKQDENVKKTIFICFFLTNLIIFGTITNTTKIAAYSIKILF